MSPRFTPAFARTYSTDSPTSWNAMRCRIRASHRASHSGFPPSTRKRAVLMTPDPTSMPMERAMRFPPLLEYRPVGEGRPAERAGVDRIGTDVDGDFAVILPDQLAKLLHRGLVLGDPPGEGELVGDAAGPGDDRHGAQHDRPVQAGQDVGAGLAQREAVAQLGAGEHRAGGVDPRGPGRLHGDGAQLVEADLHLVRDVAQVPAAAGRAPVVHLKVRDDPVLVHLDPLG